MEEFILTTQKAGGNNTTLFSFYNSNVHRDLMKLSLYHPTRGGYTDWAFVLWFGIQWKDIIRYF